MRPSMPTLTADEVALALTREGWPYAAADVVIEPRDKRWLARLADGRMAWFPMGDKGRAALDRDRRILRLLEQHCAFRAPRVLWTSRAGWDLRDPVAGVFGPTELYHRLQGDADLARRIGSDIGAALAEQHAISAAAFQGWLKTEAGWPLPRLALGPMLGRVTGDAALRARIETLLDRYDAFEAATAERVLTHGDLGLHNIVLTEGGGLAGIFDYDGAAISDAHHDFKYLIFDTETEALLDGAVATYEPASGRRVDRAAVRLLNAACAIGFLAFRDGHDADEPWCGRTLAEDIRWTDFAMRRAGL